MGGILTIAFIVGLWYLISFISFKVEETQTNFKKSKKTKEDKTFATKRASLKIYLPEIKENHYPILLLPMDREVYHFGEGLYWVKPEFTSSKNYFDDIYGASELRFFKSLKKYFQDDKIQHNQFEIKINKKKYIPDFTYIDNQNKIFVDIEIDEPYSFKTNELIHYNSSDDFRNKYLQRGGWAIIRFSEKQVIQQPEECCKFIASYLAYAYFDNNRLAKFTHVNNIIHDKTWSTTEAKILLEKSYRKTYL